MLEMKLGNFFFVLHSKNYVFFYVGSQNSRKEIFGNMKTILLGNTFSDVKAKIREVCHALLGVLLL